MTNFEQSLLVKEVIDFCQSSGLLSGTNDPEGPWNLLTDFEKAKVYALISPFHDEDNWTDWLGLRQMQMSKVYGALYKLPDQSSFFESFDVSFKNTDRLLRKRFMDTEFDWVIEDITADLFNCKLNRELGIVSPLFEQIFDAYRAGGWPCGWEGQHPDGRLVVYFPIRNKP